MIEVVEGNSALTFVLFVVDKSLLETKSTLRLCCRKYFACVLPAKSATKSTLRLCCRNFAFVLFIVEQSG